MALKLKLCFCAAPVAGSSKSSLILRFSFIVHTVAVPFNFPLPLHRTMTIYTKAGVCVHAVLGIVSVYLGVNMKNSLILCGCVFIFFMNVCVPAHSVLRTFDENPLEASDF